MKPKTMEGVLIPPGVTLPEKFQFLEPQQADAIEEILSLFRAGVDVVILDAPTGSGKTVIAEIVRQRLCPGQPSTYICTSKSLQNQFVGDFPYAKVVKGKRNYETQLMPFPDYTVDDCDRRKESDDPDAEMICSWCVEPDSCSYWRAKDEAAGADLCVVNTAYFLNETSGHLSFLRDRELTIIDECDTLELDLMGHIEFFVSPRMCIDLGVEPPKKGSHKATIQRWVVDELDPALRHKIKSLGGGGDLRARRAKRRYQNLLNQCVKVDFENEEYWVRDNHKGGLVMKPFHVHDHAGSAVWEQGHRFLLMSATPISCEEMADSLGISQSGLRWETVTVPMTFPKENRPIIMSQVANTSRKGLEAGGLEDMQRGIAAVAHMHPEDNMLVHTNSYKLAEDLAEGLWDVPHDLITYSSATLRDEAIHAFSRGTPVCVLAPSLDRGVDLPDDLCRVQVIAKVPYPYMGDPLVQARMSSDGGQLWFDVLTARALVQSIGRAVRHKNDKATTYILDEQFGRFYGKRGKQLLPSWFKEAITMKPSKEFQ